VTPEPTGISGCSVVPLFHHADDRGEFVKVFQASVAAAAGEDPTIAELFWSRSHRGVVRGLHFQIPPHAHSKLVTIISGTALDVVVDLRVGSPTFGQHRALTFDAATPAAVFIPIGCAHGFQATSDDVTIAYATSTEHAPGADRGIRWDSIDLEWPIADAVASERDAALPTLADFDSPFVYAPTP
jgi:dTDP-4-dehydrorhamnose 3,5-epimerase and related enzymes